MDAKVARRNQRTRTKKQKKNSIIEFVFLSVLRRKHLDTNANRHRRTHTHTRTFIERKLSEAYHFEIDAAVYYVDDSFIAIISCTETPSIYMAHQCTAGYKRSRSKAFYFKLEVSAATQLSKNVEPRRNIHETLTRKR